MTRPTQVEQEVHQESGQAEEKTQNVRSILCIIELDWEGKVGYITGLRSVTGPVKEDQKAIEHAEETAIEYSRSCDTQSQKFPHEVKGVMVLSSGSLIHGESMMKTLVGSRPTVVVTALVNKPESLKMSPAIIQNIKEAVNGRCRTWQQTSRNEVRESD